MGKIVFGNRQKPAGILVDPVDDARPLHPADTGKIVAAVIKQRIDQRSVIYARRRVNGHSRRLVDDDQVIVFKNHIERNVFRRRFGFFRRRHENGETVARTHFEVLVGDNVIVQTDAAAGNQFLQTGARHGGNRFPQKKVQTHPRLPVGGRQSEKYAVVVHIHVCENKIYVI